MSEQTFPKVSLTLRDHFAIAALNGLLSGGGTAAFPIGGAEVMARHAFRLADAMMKERAEPQN